MEIVMAREETDGLIFDDGVQCFVVKLEYDFKSKAGVLHLEDHSCTDMRGCIDLFKKIDPRVTSIQTIAGKRRDTWYVRIADEWQARTSPERRP
jgi:hypothetical protein